MPARELAPSGEALYALSPEDALRTLDVDPQIGLSAAQVAQRQKEYGLNELDKEEPTPLWKLVLEQFEDLLVRILLLAALLSFAIALYEEGLHAGISAFVEPLVILLILIINAVIGVWQESNAESALDALKEMQSQHAMCLRDGELVPDLPSRELVPGDIVTVKVGDKMPADLRLLEFKTTTFAVEEAALTGESTTVFKQLAAVPPRVPIQEQRNMVFAGTSVSNGTALGVVVSTGMRTEIGKIQAAVTTAGSEEEKTPLGKKLDEFGEWLSRVIAAICVLVWVMNYSKFWDPVHKGAVNGAIYYLKIAVALGVAAIPEGLPAVITLCLALGTRKMVKKNAIVRKLPSVETLGCTTVICSDKTGTLTTNEMTVTNIVYMGATVDQVKDTEVEGHSYNPVGRILDFDGLDSSSNRSLVDLARVCALCNESRVQYRGGKYVRVGEPTEAALRVLVEKLGVPNEYGAPRTEEEACTIASAYWEAAYPRLALLEFSRDRKSMSVICSTRRSSARYETRHSHRANTLFVKGAPESVLERCSHARLANGDRAVLTDVARARIMEEVDHMGERALRCLAFAVKEDLDDLAEYTGPDHAAHRRLTDPANFADVESGLTFVGLAGIKDPARPEVRPSIELCREAGIRVIIITGDNQRTAESIARDIGVFGRNENVAGKSFTGSQFMELSEPEQIHVLMSDNGSRVFSRTEPVHKQYLVRLLKRSGEVVAMTGDGVNDAPALKQADIGIAMGISGTEVAKEASDMVLADDNFATIVSAVEEGRSIYQNMKAFIRYLISSNIGEVASIFLTAALGFPEGMNPVQLLWVNLVTDGPPATALGFNPADPDIMRRPPRRKDDQLINGWVFFRYMVVGAYVGLATVGIFAYWYVWYDWAADHHPLVSLQQLSSWGHCQSWNFTLPAFPGRNFADPCAYFTLGKTKASTLSLSVLVTIEMLNALNALSEDGSLVHMPPWCNPWLLLAISFSMVMHFLILYVPFLSSLFNVVPLDWNDWKLVLAFSFPVILIDEVLKFVGRMMLRSERRARISDARTKKLD